MSLFKPKSAKLRSPTSNAKENGVFVNPPRYPELGGFNPNNRVTKNTMSVQKPGGKKIV